MTKIYRTCVLIRTLNEEQWIKIVFEALDSQSQKPDQVIIVDNESYDNTLNIAAQFKPEVFTLPRNKFSYGRSLNMGIDRAQADIVIPLSAHAIPADSNWLMNLVKYFQDETVAGVSSRIMPYPKRPYYNYLYSLFFLLNNKQKKCSPFLFWNTSSAIRKSTWEKIQFDESLVACEDFDWALKAISAGWSLIYSPLSVVLHYHNDSFWSYFRRVIVNNLIVARLLLKQSQL